MQSKENEHEQTTEVLVKDAIHAVDGIINTFNYQVLGNADRLHEEVSPDEREKLKFIVETMIKKPFRRQIGRLRNLKTLLIVIENQIQKEGEAHDDPCATNNRS